MLSAVVLAAGASSRMGSVKALLVSPDGIPFVSRIVGTFRAAGIDDVTVVTGADHERVVAAVRDHVRGPLPRFARNPDPSRGQVSSLWTGMAAGVGPDTEAMLMTLVDVPMIDAATIARVVEAWRRTAAPIVRPALGERHGHPVLFDRGLFDELRAAPLEAGAKSVVRAHANQIVNVAVEDEGCLVDVDTPGEYERLLSQSGSRGSGAR